MDGTVFVVLGIHIADTRAMSGNGHPRWAVRAVSRCGAGAVPQESPDEFAAGFEHPAAHLASNARTRPRPDGASLRGSSEHRGLCGLVRPAATRLFRSARSRWFHAPNRAGFQAAGAHREVPLVRRILSTAASSMVVTISWLTSLSRLATPIASTPRVASAL